MCLNCRAQAERWDGGDLREYLPVMDMPEYLLNMQVCPGPCWSRQVIRPGQSDIGWTHFPEWPQFCVPCGASDSSILDVLNPQHVHAT